MKEKAHDDFVIMQQMKQKYVQSETGLRIMMNERDQLKEENICLSS